MGCIARVILPGCPVAQPRVRATRRGEHASVYTDPDHPIHAYKEKLRLAARQTYRGQPLSGPLRVNTLFVFPRPKSCIWKTKKMPSYPHTKKPDRDNLDKAVLDALTGVMWHDDKQVCDGWIRKYVAAGGETPKTAIEIWEV